MHAMAGTGRVIAGRYRLKGPIGRGAMGTVWRAWDEILDREVAVKELRISDSVDPDDRAKAYQRTHREARTAARLSHPGVVTVFDVAEEDGRPWIIMELIAARSLDQIIARDGPLPPHRAADAGRQLLSALATAHAAGVLHRDVKPSNVLIADGGRAVLTDFGIATFQGDPKLTQTGMVMGSPGFTAPERIQGNPATPASDLWSLGATLYAAVEGRGPFDRAGGAITTMSAIINSDPPSAPAAAGLGTVIDALLRRNPADRPDAATAARMLGAVGPLPAGPGNRSAFVLVPPRRPDPGSMGIPGHGALARAHAPEVPPAPGPSAPAGPEPDRRPALPTSVDLPAQPDETIPVALPGARSAATGQAAGVAAPGTGGTPGGLAGQPDSMMRPVHWDGGEPARVTAQPGSAGQPLSAPPGGGAEQFWGAGLAIGGGSMPGAAPRDAPPPAGAEQAWPAAAAGPPARRSRRRVLIGLGVVLLALAVAGGLVAWLGQRQPAASTDLLEGPAAAASGTASATAVPAGFHTVTVSAATLGSTAGFRLAVPDTWNVRTQGSAMFAEAPGDRTFLQVDLTRHTYSAMLAEARYLADLTQRQGKFPGYHPLGIHAANIRDSSGAAWAFTWQNPNVGLVRALDLLYIAPTPAGQQSFALYMSAPAGSWNEPVAAFDEEMRTFQPVP